MAGSKRLALSCGATAGPLRSETASPANSTDYEYVRDANSSTTNGLLVDRHAWDTVGGFDERYFPAYCEDVDLCLALWNFGYRVVYGPRARLRHFESQSSSTPFRDFLLQRNRASWWPSGAQFFRVWPGIPIQSMAPQ